VLDIRHLDHVLTGFFVCLKAAIEGHSQPGSTGRLRGLRGETLHMLKLIAGRGTVHYLGAAARHALPRFVRYIKRHGCPMPLEYVG